MFSMSAQKKKKTRMRFLSESNWSSKTGLKEIEDLTGSISEHNLNDIRYMDDAVLISWPRKETKTTTREGNKGKKEEKSY